MDLGSNEKIVIMKAWKELICVDIHGATEMDFGESLGAMGTFSEESLTGRHGMTVFTNFDDFGQASATE